MKLLCKQNGTLARQHLNDIKKELFRKSIHICSAFTVLLLRFSRPLCVAMLTLAGILYCASEIYRSHGFKIPLVSVMTEAAARKRDENKFVMGPLTLVAGIVLTAVLYPLSAATAGILALAFGDGLASLVGKCFGSAKIPFTNGKTAEGSFACFFAIFSAMFLYTKNTGIALAISTAGMFIELLPLKDFDNIIIPVALGQLACVLLP